MKKRIIAAVMCVLAIICSVPVAAESNVDIIYTFLTDHMELNSAAACGVLANIEKESGFRTDALGDSGTSYGICQWHDVMEGAGRYTNLKNFCAERGLDYTELMSQLYYLEYELQNSYPKVWNILYSVENTPDGAYEAAYYWCYNFEVPANRGEKSEERGELAKTKYWPIYSEAEPPEGNYEVWITEADPTLNVRTGPDTTYPKSGSLPAGTKIHVTEVAHSGTFLWGKIKNGWCVLDYCKYESGALYTVEYVTGSPVTIDPQPKSVNVDIFLAAGIPLTRHGYTFTGWATEADGEAVYPMTGGIYSGNASLTLYGVWARDEAVPLVPGDVNCDGNFSIIDAITLVQYVSGYRVPFNMATADATGDGVVNVLDAIRMVRHLTGYDEPIAEPIEVDEGDDTAADDTTADDTSSDDTTGEDTTAEGTTTEDTTMEETTSAEESTAVTEAVESDVMTESLIGE